MPCTCTIYDVRREQIEEASGRLWIRLVCNLCNVEVDSNPVEMVRERAPVGRPLGRPPRVEPRYEQRGGAEF